MHKKFDVLRAQARRLVWGGALAGTGLLILSACSGGSDGGAAPASPSLAVG
ncbi:MAG: hypothetical protein JWR07_1500, partial [Nevskia sp.]|nr:hypothetical protein [Nevskia sp.]